MFVFVFSWNEYLFAFIFTIQNAKTTPLILSEMMDSVTGTNYGVLFAAATVQLGADPRLRPGCCSASSSPA